MQGSEVLTVIAEISVALAGFSGIVVALRQRGLEAWPLHELSRLRNFLELSAYSTLLALLPFVPHHLGASNDLTWSLCGFAYSIVIMTWLIVTRVTMRGEIEQRLSAGWIGIYTWGSSAFSALELVNAFGLVAPPNLGVYLLGLGWMLFFTMSMFIRLVLASAFAIVEAE